MVSVPSAAVMLSPEVNASDKVMVALLYNTGIGVILWPRQISCVSFSTVNLTVSLTVRLNEKDLSKPPHPVLLVALMVYIVSANVAIGLPLIVSLPVPWLVSTTPSGKMGETESIALLYAIGISVIALPKHRI